MFNDAFVKTLRGDGKCNRFVVKRCDVGDICPVQGLEEYFRVAKVHGIDLSSGYLFRPVLGGKTVLNDSMSYSVTYERLKTYLSALGIDDGETPHSMRAGWAVTLALSGSVETKDLMNHIGWFGKKSADYYSRSARLADSGTAADTLAKSVVDAKAIKMDFKLKADFLHFKKFCDK